MVLYLKVGESFKREDVKKELETADKKTGEKAEYAISDGAHNLGGGIRDYGPRRTYPKIWWRYAQKRSKMRANLGAHN